MRAWCLTLLFLSSPAFAQEQAESTPAPHLEPLAADSPRVRFHLADETQLRVGGYLETFYSWNFNDPANRVTGFRAFDNRHNQFTLQAVALDIGFVSRHVEARVVGQAGNGPATYYGASEPTVPGTALTPASDATLWRFVQQAWIGWSPLPGKLTIDAGIFLSPIGPESMATYQNAHWSHSILFFALPFYHAGARVRWTPVPGHTIRFGVRNGWNNAFDNNSEKTLGVDYAYSARPGLLVGGSYFAGVERPSGAPEGRAWRQLLDVWTVWQPISRLTLLAEADGGMEPNAFGTSGWAGGNLSARVAVAPWLFIAGRSTIFWERRASRDGVTAAAIAIPAGRITSQTLTLEAIPALGLSFKLEGRYDAADERIFFAGRVAGDGSPSAPFVADSRDQLTVTLGASAWF